MVLLYYIFFEMSSVYMREDVAKAATSRIQMSEFFWGTAAGGAGEGGKTLPVLFPFDCPRQKRQSRLSHGQNSASLAGAVGSNKAET